MGVTVRGVLENGDSESIRVTEDGYLIVVSSAGGGTGSPITVAAPDQTSGAEHVFASAKEWEEIIFTGSPAGDFDITINGGLAMAIYCETDNDVLVVDTTRVTNQATPSLKAGFNPFEVTKVYAVGTTIAGKAWAVAW